MIEGQLIQQVVAIDQETMDAEGWTGPQPIGLVVDDFSVVYPLAAGGGGQWLGVVPGRTKGGDGFTGLIDAEVVGSLLFERRVITNILRINFPAQTGPEYPTLVLTGGAWLLATNGNSGDLAPGEIIVRTLAGDRFSIPL